MKKVIVSIFMLAILACSIWFGMAVELKFEYFDHYKANAIADNFRPVVLSIYVFLFLLAFVIGLGLSFVTKAKYFVKQWVGLIVLLIVMHYTVTQPVAKGLALYVNSQVNIGFKMIGGPIIEKKTEKSSLGSMAYILTFRNELSQNIDLQVIPQLYEGYEFGEMFNGRVDVGLWGIWYKTRSQEDLSMQP